MEVVKTQGACVMLCPADGPKLGTDRDATELISAAWEHHATLVAIPVDRLDPDFFRLNTRLAGEFVEKFVIYRVRLAILGSIAAFVEQSSALRDFVRESNRGENVWFVANLGELEKRLAKASR